MPKILKLWETIWNVASSVKNYSHTWNMRKILRLSIFTSKKLLQMQKYKSQHFLCYYQFLHPIGKQEIMMAWNPIANALIQLNDGALDSISMYPSTHWTVSLYPSTHHHDANLFYLNISSHLVFKLCRKHFQLSSMICCCVVHICCKSAPVPGPNVRCQKYWQESKEGTSLKIPALKKSNLRFDQLGR